MLPLSFSRLSFSATESSRTSTVTKPFSAFGEAANSATFRAQPSQKIQAVSALPWRTRVSASRGVHSTMRSSCPASKAGRLPSSEASATVSIPLSSPADAL